MSVSARPLHPLFAAELGGIDLRLPIDDAQVQAFRVAMDQYAVGVIHHSTPFSDAQHVEFTRRGCRFTEGRAVCLGVFGCVIKYLVKNGPLI